MGNRALEPLSNQWWAREVPEPGDAVYYTSAGGDGSSSATLHLGTGTWTLTESLRQTTETLSGTLEDDELQDARRAVRKAADASIHVDEHQTYACAATIIVAIGGEVRGMATSSGVMDGGVVDMFRKLAKSWVKEHFGALESLPLSLSEPHYFLSNYQASVLSKKATSLVHLRRLLPCWIPHRHVANALGFSMRGIETALAHTGGYPYVWATEFENVHSLWRFDEEPIEVDGQRYSDIETYYRAQKPEPFDSDLWDTQRVEVMRKGVEEKFKRVTLRELLLSTRNHPLVSIKPDRFWGVDARQGGENMLAKLIEKHRAKLHFLERISDW